MEHFLLMKSIDIRFPWYIRVVSIHELLLSPRTLKLDVYRVKLIIITLKIYNAYNIIKIDLSDLLT